MGRETVLDQRTWVQKVMRTFKRRRGFSSVRRICISCRAVALHPNDRNFDGKLCEQCLCGDYIPCTPVLAGLRPDQAVLGAGS